MTDAAITRSTPARQPSRSTPQRTQPATEDVRAMSEAFARARLTQSVPVDAPSAHLAASLSIPVGRGSSVPAVGSGASPAIRLNLIMGGGSPARDKDASAPSIMAWVG